MPVHMCVSLYARYRLVLFDTYYGCVFLCVTSLNMESTYRSLDELLTFLIESGKLKMKKNVLFGIYFEKISVYLLEINNR